MGTIECHRSTLVAMFVQKSSIIAHGKLCCYRGKLQEHREAVGTAEYYKNIREAMLVQTSTNGTLGGCTGTASYYRSTKEAVLLQQNTIGALGRLCGHRILL